MNVKKIVIVNIIMAALLAINIGLAVYPLGLVYAVLLLRFSVIFIIMLIVMAVNGFKAYSRLHNREKLSAVLRFIGCIGAVIGINTVYKDYEEKERVYFAFSMMIWPFVIYPLVMAVLLFCTDICWFPSV